MTSKSWSPVFAGESAQAALVQTFLEGDGIEVKSTPDLDSLPLQSPGAHNVKSRFSREVLLVNVEDAERAAELVELFLVEESE